MFDLLKTNRQYKACVCVVSHDLKNITPQSFKQLNTCFIGRKISDERLAEFFERTDL